MSAFETFPPFIADDSAEGASAVDARAFEECKQLLVEVLKDTSELLALYRLPDLKLAYFNRAANERLNPGGKAATGTLTLWDVVGLSSRQRFEAEILPQTRVLGRWKGDCELRDVWGGEFAVKAVFRSITRSGEKFLAMCAQEHGTAVELNGARFTDRQLLHALLDYAPDSIYFKDIASRFIRISRSQAEKFGLTDPAQAIGRTDFDFFTVAHAGPAFANEQQIIRSGQPIVDREERETWADGRVSWVSTTKLPLYDAAGKPIGTFGVSRDITARKEAEAERREMETQLQLAQKMESIGRLAAGVAHEINTPTQFITDNTHFLADAFARYEVVIARYRALRDAVTTQGSFATEAQAVAAAEQEAELDYLLQEIPRCVQQTLDGLKRVTRIVRSLKEFAHPNSAELTPADLNRVIETSIDVSRHEWKYVADVALELEANLPQVPCVVDEFNQVMLNLVINAAHAIGDALKQRGDGRGKIAVRTRHEAPWAVLEIEDTGTGIPPEIRERIFEPFFTTKPPGKGTGQGLAIVHTVIVKHHHGTIDVVTEPGRGTKFVIKLPLAEPPEGA
jgi:PAS domain S-box-containing protein